MNALKRLGLNLFRLLKELADENAYQRYLAYHGRAHSAAEWRRFCEHRLSSRFVRPRCC